MAVRSRVVDMTETDAPALKPGELGKLLGVPSRTVRRWALSGKLPTPQRTLSNHTRWNPYAVARAYADRGIEPPAQFSAYMRRIVTEAST